MLTTSTTTARNITTRIFSTLTLGIVLSVAAVAAEKPSHYASDVNRHAEHILMIGEDMGLTNRPLSDAELGFLLEVSNLRVLDQPMKTQLKDVNNRSQQLGFLLEVSGLNKRPIQRSDVQILIVASDFGFTATDDLARVMAEISGYKEMVCVEDICSILLK